MDLSFLKDRLQRCIDLTKNIQDFPDPPSITANSSELRAILATIHANIEHIEGGGAAIWVPNDPLSPDVEKVDNWDL